MEATLDAVPDTPAAPVSPLQLVRGLAGFAALGVVGTMGGHDPLSGSPVALVTSGGMLLLTVPALLVAHQYLRLSASPSALVAELARTFARCGDLALGATPALLLFTVTSGLGSVVTTLILAGVAVLGFALSVGRLVRAEDGASGRAGAMTLLVLGWCGLASLVGLRLFASFAPHLF